MSEHEQAHSTTLRDAHPDYDSRLPIRLAISPNGVTLYADGYGDCTSGKGHGTPVFIKVYKGELRLLVRSDINNEDPTHVISLGGAREDRRRPDDEE